MPPSPPLAPTAPPLPSDGPSQNTRNRVAQQEESGSGDENQAVGLYPQREVPLGGVQGGIEFVTVPLNLSDAKMLKKELKGLLEDPIGLAEQLDQFLRPNIYTWEEMQSMMTMLFTPEERHLIWAAGMRIWEREHMQGSPGDLKMLTVHPNWDHNSAGGRENMEEYRTLIVRSIKEAAPQSQNAGRGFNEQQKEETPTEWVERLRKNMRQYSGIDPNMVAGQILLKINFVTHPWPDIYRKLKKLEG